MWSFNRERDASKIESRRVIWQGPFSWPGYAAESNIDEPPDLAGVYLWTFRYRGAYLIYAAGVTNSTRKRLRSHTAEYKKGRYTVLDVSAAEKGERCEIWHGWNYAKTHQHEFVERREEILRAVGDHLLAFRIFVTQEHDKRIRERLEAAIMQGVYCNKEPWSELADRGMYLSGRYNSEMPLLIQNYCEHKIYGLPESFEI